MGFVSLMAIIKEKPKVDSQKIKSKESKHNNTENHHKGKEKGKEAKDLQNNYKQLTKWQ